MIKITSRFQQVGNGPDGIYLIGKEFNITLLCASLTDCDKQLEKILDKGSFLELGGKTYE